MQLSAHYKSQQWSFSLLVLFYMLECCSVMQIIKTQGCKVESFCRVLRPPGGGSNFSLGFDEPKEQPVRRNKMASSIFGTPEENPPSWAKSSGKNVFLVLLKCINPFLVLAWSCWCLRVETWINLLFGSLGLEMMSTCMGIFLFWITFKLFFKITFYCMSWT